MAGNRKFDPESFRGKIVLLAVDKLIIGAIIAAALFLYQRWHELDERSYLAHLASESREYQENSARVQLDLERARLLKEVLPTIVDDSVNATVRGYLLRAGVVTGSMDSATSVSLLSKLQRKGLSDQDFRTIAVPMVRGGLPAILGRSRQLLERYSEVVAPDGSFRVEDYSSVEDELEQIEVERRLWLTAMEDALKAGLSYSELDSPEFMGQHFLGLYYLYTMDYDLTKACLSRAQLGFRLVGQAWSVKSNGVRGEEYSRQFFDFFATCGDSLSKVTLCRSVVDALVKRFPRPGPGAALALSQLVIADGPNIAPGSQESELLRREWYSLQWATLEALHSLATQGPKVVRKDVRKVVEPNLILTLSRFRTELSKVALGNQEEADRLSNRYEGGNLIRPIVSILGGPGRSQSAESELKATLGLGSERLRAFPFLEEELERALQAAVDPKNDVPFASSRYDYSIADGVLNYASPTKK